MDNTRFDAEEVPEVIVLDDEEVVLEGTLQMLGRTLVGGSLSGFTRPSEALAFARSRPVALAFVDIELGRTSGLEICRQLIETNPRTNVVFLTAYAEYALDAWAAGACGFLLKPITAEAVSRQLGRLRYPVPELTVA